MLPLPPTLLAGLCLALPLASHAPSPIASTTVSVDPQPVAPVSPAQDPSTTFALTGELAPPLGDVRWLGLDPTTPPWTQPLVDAGLAPPPPAPGELADWTGRAILVHALRVGPGLARLRAAHVADVARANLDRELAVVTLLELPEDADSVEVLDAWRAELGGGLVCIADPARSPYLRALGEDDDRLFVISRTGVLVDQQPGEALEAVLGHLRLSLFWPAAPPLEGPRPPALEQVFTRYDDGEWQRARVLARRTVRGLDEGDPLVRRVGEIVAQVDALEAACADRVRTFAGGTTAAELLPWVRLRRDLLRGFPGLPCTSELLLAMDPEADEATRAAADLAAAWLAVLARRPIAFPERRGDDDEPFLRELRGTLRALGDDPLAAVGRAWLERYEAAGTTDSGDR